MVNAYLRSVHARLPSSLADPVYLFSTFFFSKLLGTLPPPINASSRQLLEQVAYTDVRRCGPGNLRP